MLLFFFDISWRDSWFLLMEFQSAVHRNHVWTFLIAIILKVCRISWVLSFCYWSQSTQNYIEWGTIYNKSFLSNPSPAFVDSRVSLNWCLVDTNNFWWQWIFDDSSQFSDDLGPCFPWTVDSRHLTTPNILKRCNFFMNLGVNMQRFCFYNLNHNIVLCCSIFLLCLTKERGSEQEEKNVIKDEGIEMNF